MNRQYLTWSTSFIDRFQIAQHAEREPERTEMPGCPLARVEHGDGDRLDVAMVALERRNSQLRVLHGLVPLERQHAALVLTDRSRYVVLDEIAVLDECSYTGFDLAAVPGGQVLQLVFALVAVRKQIREKVYRRQQPRPHAVAHEIFFDQLISDFLVPADVDQPTYDEDQRGNRHEIDGRREHDRQHQDAPNPLYARSLQDAHAACPIGLRPCSADPPRKHCAGVAAMGPFPAAPSILDFDPCSKASAVRPASRLDSSSARRSPPLAALPRPASQCIATTSD